MKLTYNEALYSVIEHTEIGYTVASQDKLWIVFIFDLVSEGEYASLRYNRLYPCEREEGSQTWAYDLTIDGVMVWTSRHEAEVFATELRERLSLSYAAFDGSEPPEVHVMNLGDDCRYETLIIGGYGARNLARRTPKFKGSERAWDARIEMHNRWLIANQAV